MKCEYCGRVIQQGEYSCPGCGAPVEHPESVNSADAKCDKRTKIEVKVGDVNISIDGVTSGEKQGVPPLHKEKEKYRAPEAVVTKEMHFDFDSHNKAKSKIKYGGFIVRVIATWLDWIICFIITTGIVVVTGYEFEFGIFSLIWAAYDIISLTYFDGATPGKKGMRVKVVNKDYEKVSLMQAVIRTAGKIILWPICISYLMVPFSNKKRSLHDCIAGTYVIKD